MIFPPAFQNNIIAQVELTYVRRIGVQNGLLHRIGNMVTRVTSAWWVLFVLAVWWDSFQKSHYQLPLENLIIPISCFLIITLVLHFATIFRTLAVASESIMREKRGRTWETLILTGVDARKVVLGKWWATMCAVWRDYAWLVVLRAGAVMAVGLMLDQASFSPGTVQTTTGNILAALFLSIPFTVFNLIFTAAAGVLGGLLTNRRDGVATPMAQTVRMTVILIPVVSVIAVGLYLVYAPGAPQIDPESMYPVMIFALALLDNGLLVSAGLVNIHDPNSGQLLITAVITLVFYGVLTFGLLLTAQYVAQRQGVLSPRE